MRTSVKLLPVAGRELRVASRRRGTYWVRFGAASIGIAATGVIMLAMMREPLSSQAQVLMGALGVLGFLYALVAGVLSTADCVSEEKREGTLGLLFLTDLKGYDVVAGKVVAHSLRSVTVLVSLVPVLWLPVLMGAVTGSTVWTLVLVLGNTMFLGLALGVLISALVRDARFAIGGAIFLMLLIVAGIPFLRWMVVEYVIRPPQGTGARSMSGLPEPLGGLLLINPAMLFFWAQSEILGAGIAAAGRVAHFWNAFWIQQGMAWAALIGASFLVPRRWQDRVETRPGPTRAKPVAAGGGPAGETIQDRVGRPVTAAEEDRTDLLDRHPFGWIVARERRSAVMTWAGLAVVGVVWLWGFAEVRDDWLQGVIGLWTIFFGGLWLKFRVAVMACRHLHEHRRSGALELVLCTAQTPSSIVAGNLAGLRRLLLPPVTVLLSGAALLLVAAIGQERGIDATELSMLFIGMMGLVVLDLWALAWGGMWQGLRSARYVRALSLTVWRVMLLPWVAFLVSVILVGVSVETLGILSGFNPSTTTVVVWWVILSVGADLWFVLQARSGLSGRLRDLALDHYGTGDGVANAVLPPATAVSTPSVPEPAGGK